MRGGLEATRRRTLDLLGVAYARGLITTATLEVRVGDALRAGDLRRLAGCTWDLAAVLPWWARRIGRRRVPSALVLGDVRIELGPGVRRIVIGRSRACDVRVSEPSVSARHAEVAWRGGACCVRDLGSTNGTRLNGRSVETGELLRGDEVMLGALAVRVV